MVRARSPSSRASGRPVSALPMAVIAEPLSEALLVCAEGSYLQQAARALVQRTGPSPEPKLRPPVEAEGCAFECGTAGPA